MRGAVDALGVMPPIGDPDYATLRGKLAFGPEQVLPVRLQTQSHPERDDGRKSHG
jgi:uncharacterized protein (DUF1501 family)